MKNRLTPPCDNCKERKVINPFSDLPTMLGFQQEDGSIINICSDCLMKLGRMNDAEKDKFFEGLGVKHE